MISKKTKIIFVLVVVVLLIYFLVILPKQKQKLATEIVEKYPDENFDYEVLKTYSTKCLKGILNDPKFICQ